MVPRRGRSRSTHTRRGDARDRIGRARCASPSNRMRTFHEYLELVRLFGPSLATAGAVALGGSQVGTFVLLRREGMMALALPQVVTVGVALSLRWGLEEHADHGGMPGWMA